MFRALNITGWEGRVKPSPAHQRRKGMKWIIFGYVIEGIFPGAITGLIPSAKAWLEEVPEGWFL